MRKLVSTTIVCAMMLTLFLGMFGGVVEEVEGPSTFDATSNTIFVNGNGNTLWSIWWDTGQNASLFDQAGPASYITYANIRVTVGSDLTIFPGDILKFDLNLNITVSGELFVTGVEGDMATFSSKSITPAIGDWQGLIFNTTQASNSNLNYLNISYAIVGIECKGSSPTISNTVVTQCSDNGISVETANPTFNSVHFSNNGNGNSEDAGLLLISSSPFIENSTFINNPDSDIRLKSSSHPTILNSSFTFGKIIFSDATGSNITVKWYLEVYVEDDNTLQPIDGASIGILDVFDNTIDGSPFSTNVEGVSRWIQTVSYVRDNSGKIDYTPHNVSIFHSEYYTGYAIPEPNIISSMRIQVNLTMIRRDLTTNEENITFSPDGIVVANEDVTVFAKIHNIEVDDAEDVRIVIMDGSIEIHNSTISIIEGNSFKNAIDMWQPTPGIHTIEVNIDPYNEINEINSNPGINAETNNNAQKQLQVNFRPLINITVPVENSEVNETITIQGTAIDETTDNLVSPNGTNQIVRVDVRLKGYNWIELTSWPELIQINGTDWNWQYDWDDTTQWDGTPINDGNYTLQARAWDNYHYSFFNEVPITVNNTGTNAPPNAVISAPLDGAPYNVNEIITFDGSDSNDTHTSPEDLDYSWDFDDTVDNPMDGNFTNDGDANGNITSHSYSEKGYYTTTLTVTDESDFLDTDSVTVWIWNYLPVPDIFVNNTTVYENDTVQFNGSASYDPDGVITTFSWNFEDGSPPITGYFPIVEHEFNESRIFNVTLTVFDNNGTYNTTWIFIDVLPNEAPNAVIDEPFEAQRFDINETITFNASSSSDVNDEDLSYFWDFGDGTDSGWLDQPVTTHYYSEYGPNILPFPFSYNVILTVKDNEELTDTSTVNIQVNNYPPVAIAISDNTSADTYEDIFFDGSGSYDPNDGISSYLWDFDDGTIAITPTATHQFEQNGVFNVTLTVWDGFGANDTDWIIISIANREPVFVNVTVDPASPIIDEEITITINAIDEDGIIERYYWSFGDGNEYFENTTMFPDGAFDGITTHTYTSKSSYTLLVEVTDDDTLTNSTFLIITLVNAVPEVTISDPTQNETVAEITTITGTSTDRDSSVSQVQLKIDDGNWVEAQDTSSDDSWSTWSYDWDTEDGYANGNHTIYARGYDNEDYTDPPTNISVTVDNLPTDITTTIDLDPETVEALGTVTVYGDVTYNTGDPVEGALINVTIFNEVGSWETTTSSSGFYTVEITAPDTSGNHRVYVDAEKDSFTDTQYQFLTVTPLPEKPDLTLTNNDIDFNPSAPFSGEAVQITITVYNNGDSNANNVLVNVYDGNPQTGGTSIGSTTTSVNADSQTDVIVDWSTTGITGTFTVNVIIDPNDDIEEVDEDNNQAQKPITISGQPDFTLEATDITFSKESPGVGDPISILIRIYNDGTESGTVNYEVYEEDPDLGGLLIDSKEETISANDDKTVIVQWIPEEGGEFDIYVVLDRDDDVDETDEDNNIAYATITVEEEPKEDGFPTWMIFIMIALVVVVVIIMLIFYLRSKGPKIPKVPKPQKQELPLAQVVESEPKQQAKTVAAKDDDDKELVASMGGQGGIRIG